MLLIAGLNMVIKIYFYAPVTAPLLPAALRKAPAAAQGR
jgi:hypothetical protein